MLRHKRLVGDLILVILDHVIGSTPAGQEQNRIGVSLLFDLIEAEREGAWRSRYQPAAQEAILDDFNDEGGCFFFTQTGVETLPATISTRRQSFNAVLPPPHYSQGQELSLAMNSEKLRVIEAPPQ